MRAAEQRVRDLGEAALEGECSPGYFSGRRPYVRQLPEDSSEDEEEEVEEEAQHGLQAFHALVGREAEASSRNCVVASRASRSAQVVLACVLFFGALAATHSRLRPAPPRQPLPSFATAWRVPPARRPAGHFCNASLAFPEVRHAVKFELAPYWQSYCERVNPPRGAFFQSHWEGQDVCWAWVKKLGCYETTGSLSWLDSQRRAAKSGLAPHPEAQPMLGLGSPDVCEHRELGAPLMDLSQEEFATARQWLQENIGIYVLNLDRDVKRLRNMTKRMSQLNFTFTRIPGVDLSKPGGLDWAYREGLVPSEFNFTLAQLHANTSYHGIGGILGTVGCASAHLNTMRKAVEDTLAHQPAKPLALVLEDDVVLSDDFAPKLKRLLETEVPCDWVALSLQSRCPFGKCVSPHLTRVEPDGNEPEDRCRHGVNYGFFAMLYRVQNLTDLRTRLADVVWNEDRPRCLDVDVALASISDEIPYYAVPAMQRPGFLSEGSQGSSRWDLNLASTTTTSTPRPTTTTTLTQTLQTTTTITMVAHFPSIPGGGEHEESPLLVLGDGHYVVDIQGDQEAVSGKVVAGKSNALGK